MKQTRELNNDRRRKNGGGGGGGGGEGSQVAGGLYGKSPGNRRNTSAEICKPGFRISAEFPAGYFVFYLAFLYLLTVFPLDSDLKAFDRIKEQIH